MFTLMEPQATCLKILHLEDDSVTQRIVKDLLRIQFEDVELLQHETGIALGLCIPFEKPNIIIVDWMLKDCCAKDLIKTLGRFKGLVLFFSSNEKDSIESCIVDKLGVIPNNFKVYTKNVVNAYPNIMKEVKSYAYEIGKKI